MFIDYRMSRDRPGVGVVGGAVYLVGGASTRQLLDTVERWDQDTDTWTTLAPLNVPRQVDTCRGPCTLCTN